MANIGQIVYNIEDYYHSGGYISTSKNDISKTISSNDYASWEEYLAAAIDIFNQNLVELFNTTGFFKLGIQAPPGTLVILNDSKNIVIGKTGIYELDEDIIISSLKFIPQKIYRKDEEKTLESLNAGLMGMQEAENARNAALINAANLTEEEYNTQYQIIQETFLSSYEESLKLYNLGVNGVYIFEDEYELLHDVIIDFIYK